MKLDVFKDVVAEALDGLPDVFKKSIENVEIVIEDGAPVDIMASHPGSLILGLYQGVPMKHRGHYYAGVLPDKISIYRNAITSVSTSKEDMIDNIRKTLLHEIGHYYGITDKKLRELGY